MGLGYPIYFVSLKIGDYPADKDCYPRQKANEIQNVDR